MGFKFKKIPLGLHRPTIRKDSFSDQIIHSRHVLAAYFFFFFFLMYLYRSISFFIPFGKDLPLLFGPSCKPA